MSTLIVCIGNICRSPIAEAIFRKNIHKDVTSSGLFACVGSPADPFSVRVAKDHGYDLSSHIAKQINIELVQKSQIIMVMDKIQRQQLEKMFPGASGKIYLIGRFSEIDDIPDPYKKPYNYFETTFSLINESIMAWKNFYSNTYLGAI